MSWIFSPAPKPMQKKGIGLPGRTQEYVDPFFRTILSNLTDQVNRIPLRAKKKPPDQSSGGALSGNGSAT